MDEVADCVQAELESLAVEDDWDRSGRRRDGYVDPGDTAWRMFEAALNPFREEMVKYQQLSMPVQAEALTSVPTITCWTVWRSAQAPGKLAVGMFPHLSFVTSKV
jgi:hypothetical protein